MPSFFFPHAVLAAGRSGNLWLLRCWSSNFRLIISERSPILDSFEIPAAQVLSITHTLRDMNFLPKVNSVATFGNHFGSSFYIYLDGSFFFGEAAACSPACILPDDHGAVFSPGHRSFASPRATDVGQWALRSSSGRARPMAWSGAHAWCILLQCKASSGRSALRRRTVSAHARRCVI